MVFVCVGLVIVTVLCVFNVIKIGDKKWIALWAVILPHIALFIDYVIEYQNNLAVKIIFTFWIVVLALFTTIKFNILPLTKKSTEDKRLNVLMGGRKLLLTSIYVFIIQTVIFVLLFTNAINHPFALEILITDLVVNIIFWLLLYVNGFFRIIALSRRLNIIKKIIFVCLMWIPLVNFFVMMIMCRAVIVEYAHELYKINQNKWRVESKLCDTKYPLIMLHGVGFRDLKYLNYWGRIPKALIKNGATVYYGNQEAWGTIEANAEDVKNKILEIVETTGAKKVNIIAHSKGGLDARYMISKLGMEDYVASLTSISTPHRGSFVMDFVDKLPKGLVKFIGNIINRSYRAIGDKNPDFHTASKQFLTSNAEKFNKEVKDSDKVYYQSYATIMSRPYSDYILFVPYIIGWVKREKNDGLVSIGSAQWGEFKGVMETKNVRGISHGDIVDLRRNDYKGFDTREFYVKLVNELKGMGY